MFLTQIYANPCLRQAGNARFTQSYPQKSICDHLREICENLRSKKSFFRNYTFVKNLILTSYAKLNLYLKILGKRPDNYHSIFTLFEKVSLSDQIRLKLLPNREIRIALFDSSLPLTLGRSNLAYRAADLLQRKFLVSDGVEISINKQIPISAGLGGGSSNAATVLAGLNRLWRLNLKSDCLASLARRIGSDVPFFLHNSSFAIATSRGDQIKTLRLPVKLWHIIVVPRVKVLSSLIYKKWDHTRKKDKGLTNQQSIIKILTSALLKKDMLLLSKLLFNSLEEVSAAMYPVVGKLKSILSDFGLEAISMSGSGPAVFGLVSSRKEAYAIVGQLRKLGNWDVFVAKTV